jgi:hypothetical protein
MNRAQKAVETGHGRQLIDDLICEQKRLGLNDRKSVYEVLTLLELYREEDEHGALVLIRHLKDWVKDYASRLPPS